MSKWLKKAIPPANGKARGKGPTCQWLAKDFPALHELMTLLEDEGKPREACKLGLFVQDGACKARLQDPNSKQVLFLTADSFRAVLEALEMVLQEGTGEWRPDKFAGQKKN